MTESERETFARCVLPKPEILNGTLEDMLAKIDRNSIVKNCRDFRSIVPCAHNTILKLREMLEPDDVDSNQTIAKYHTMYYACTKGFPLFMQRDLCSAKIDQEAINGGRCSAGRIFNGSMVDNIVENGTIEQQSAIECAMFSHYFTCTRDRTENECHETEHHLNLNIWKIAALYYQMIQKCDLDLSTSTVFEPDPLPVFPSELLAKSPDPKPKKPRKSEEIRLTPIEADGKVKYRISGIVTLEKVEK